MLVANAEIATEDEIARDMGRGSQQKTCSTHRMSLITEVQKPVVIKPRVGPKLPEGPPG
jgi:hypothetical protein